MVVDPGLGFLFNGVAARIMANVWPTKLEKAQTRHALESLDLERQRQLAEEERSRLDRDERREARLQQLEHQTKLHSAGIEATRDLQLELNSLLHWPLDVMPQDFIRASRAREAARAPSSAVRAPLNVLFKLTSVLGPGSGAARESERLVQSALVAALSRLRGRTGHYFHDDLATFTTDVTDEVAGRSHRGDSLASTVYSRLSTEPVALVELFVDRIGTPAKEGQAASPSTIGVAISHWGWVMDIADSHGATSPPFGSEGIVYFDIDLSSDTDLARIDDTFLTLLTGLRDVYVTLTSLRKPSPMTMFRVLPELGEVRFWRYGEHALRTTLDAKALLRGSHHGMIQVIVADHAPLIAVEAAAQASSDAKAAGDARAAKDYLDLAIENARNSVTDGPRGRSNFIRYLLDADVQGRLPAFREAVAHLLPEYREASGQPEDVPSAPQDLRASSRLFTTPKN